MTQQLARYERELRASHVAMAHELRSPLTAAIGRLQGILDGVFQPEPQQLAMIMKQLTQLSRLTDELHLLSLADAGQLTLNRDRFNLSEMLRERTGWLMPQAREAGVVISVGPVNDIFLFADPFRLGKVVTILCENALRYGADGGRLVITASQHDRVIALTFRDYGHGVKHSFLPTLFPG